MEPIRENTTPGTSLCRNCGHPLDGNFCANCGQPSATEMVPFRDWLGQAFNAVTGLDFKLLKTLKHLFLRPGFLTEEYREGRRMPYTQPLRLYIVVSAVSIAVMSLFGFLSYEKMVNPEIEAALQLSGRGDSAYQEAFDRRLNVVYPIVNLLSPVLFGLLLKLLHRRQLYELHFVFSLHYFSFVVLAGLAALPAAAMGPRIGGYLTLALGVMFSIYLGLALRRVLGGPWWVQWPRFLVLCVGLFFVIQTLGTLAIVLVQFSLA